MLSTELYTALEIMARREYREIVRLNQPWKRPTRKERHAEFHLAWQMAVFAAAADLNLPLRDAYVLDLQRAVPTGLIESDLEVVHVRPGEPATPPHADRLQ